MYFKIDGCLIGASRAASGRLHWPFASHTPPKNHHLCLRPRPRTRRTRRGFRRHRCVVCWCARQANHGFRAKQQAQQPPLGGSNLATHPDL